ncbi:hypothetical protein BT63DRAFT_459192 [Microthyrium microscopicum]|uniref:RanBD1 domain-containing protein n=1 Tax=Microthyrium microscopicum TaxID=703497 RepID=A0A6A6U129_9PEZI|nr:hypothetical protein BT63DRAFT_459192 [Microthyrium microscopicum]
MSSTNTDHDAKEVTSAAQAQVTEPTTPPTNDNEHRESPVREKLEQTTIDANSKPNDPSNDPSSATKSEDAMSTTESSGSGSLRGKRSRDEVDQDAEDGDQTDPKRHGRKRSRDGSSKSPELVPSVDAANTDTIMNGSASANATTTPPRAQPSSNTAEGDVPMTSPKGKRSRDQYLKEDNIPSLSNELHSASSDKPKEKLSDERGAKRPRDGGESNDVEAPNLEEQVPEAATIVSKLAGPGGFSNTSAISPFAALSGSKFPAPKDTTTSQSAFESSSFSKLANAKTSGFAALGSTSGSASPFGAISGAKSPPSIIGLAKTESAFGGAASTTSGFSALAAKPGSGFGGLAASSASPFGSALSGRPGLSAFGSSSTGFALNPPTTGLGSKPTRTFGAPVSDEEEDGDASETDDDKNVEAEGNNEGPQFGGSSETKDARFVQKEVETGEENETTMFANRGTLFLFDGAWKECGRGVFKLNISNEQEYEEPSESSGSDSQNEEQADEEADTTPATDAQDDAAAAKDSKPTAKTSKKRRADDEDTAQATPKRKRRTARLIMRQEGTNRLVLNGPFTKDSPFGNKEGKRPEGVNTLFFRGHIPNSDKSQTMLLRMKADKVEEAWKCAEEIRSAL